MEYGLYDLTVILDAPFFAWLRIKAYSSPLYLDKLFFALFNEGNSTEAAKAEILSIDNVESDQDRFS